MCLMPVQIMYVHSEWLLAFDDAFAGNVRMVLSVLCPLCLWLSVVFWVYMWKLENLYVIVICRQHYRAARHHEQYRHRVATTKP